MQFMLYLIFFCILFFICIEFAYLRHITQAKYQGLHHYAMSSIHALWAALMAFIFMESFQLDNLLEQAVVVFFMSYVFLGLMGKKDACLGSLAAYVKFKKLRPVFIYVGACLLIMLRPMTELVILCFAFLIHFTFHRVFLVYLSAFEYESKILESKLLSDRSRHVNKDHLL